MERIPENLKRARRALDSLIQVKILNDWNYDISLKKWYLHICIEIDTSNMHIPKVTQWYIVAPPEYPQGKIKVYPDVENSICVTMYHQNNNDRVEQNGLWRKGALCLGLNTIETYDVEPMSIDDRLLYHVDRAISWLNAAVSNKLVSKKDLFELPDFNHSYKLIKKFVFSEDVVSFMQWEDAEINYGIAELAKIPHACETYFVKKFNSVGFNTAHIVTWGNYLSDINSDSKTFAPWILLKSVPVLNIWQPPRTFQELKKICLDQGIDILDILKITTKYVRDGKRHFLLVGFPIPKYFYGDNESVFWQALYLPVLSNGKKTANGFRNKENGYWLRDKQEILRDSMQLDWLESENWNQYEITQRGQMNNAFLRKSILVIGAGCVAAALSEILVRSGVYNLTIMDNDLFEVGNLTRHTLSLDDVGFTKESSLCEHLNSINPHARVECIEDKIQINSSGELNIDLEQYDVIVDCTGSNDALEILSQIRYRRIHDIISVSVGLGAKHLYVTMHKGRCISLVPFYELISPYLSEDRLKYENTVFPRDGTGCWHPTFPARSDDIWLAVSTSTKLIERFVVDDSTTSVSIVFEQQESEGVFTGYTMVKKRNE